jgi:hypothetical protein
LQAYLEAGGIPDVLKSPELPLLRNLYDDVTAIRELASYLISHENRDYLSKPGISPNLDFAIKSMRVKHGNEHPRQVSMIALHLENEPWISIRAQIWPEGIAVRKPEKPICIGLLAQYAEPMLDKVKLIS